MTKRDPFVRLRHMLDYAKEAVAMVKGKTAEELNENRQLNLALTHLVELIGEAASKIPRNVQARHHEIPWPKIISMRNRLIHGYDFVACSSATPQAPIRKNKRGDRGNAPLLPNRFSRWSRGFGRHVEVKAFDLLQRVNIKHHDLRS